MVESCLKTFWWRQYIDKLNALHSRSHTQVKICWWIKTMVKVLCHTGIHKPESKIMLDNCIHGLVIIWHIRKYILTYIVGIYTPCWLHTQLHTNNFNTWIIFNTVLLFLTTLHTYMNCIVHKNLGNLILIHMYHKGQEVWLSNQTAPHTASETIITVSHQTFVRPSNVCRTIMRYGLTLSDQRICYKESLKDWTVYVWWTVRVTMMSDQLCTVWQNGRSMTKKPSPHIYAHFKYYTHHPC